MQQRRTTSGPRYRDQDSKHLLTGFVRCSTCGGRIGALDRSHGKYRAHFYGCRTCWKSGKCSNRLVLPVGRVDRAVLTALGGEALSPKVISAIIEAFLAEIVPANVAQRVDALRQQLRVIETKIQRLTAAIEHGVDVASVADLLQARHQEREGLIRDITEAETLHRIEIDRPRLEQQVQQVVARWQDLLGGSMADARQLLREVLAEPLRFEPVGETYRFQAPLRTGELVLGCVARGVSSQRETGLMTYRNS
jgi:hypothetical protein